MCLISYLGDSLRNGAICRPLGISTHFAGIWFFSRFWQDSPIKGKECFCDRVFAEAVHSEDSKRNLRGKNLDRSALEDLKRTKSSELNFKRIPLFSWEIGLK